MGSELAFEIGPIRPPSEAQSLLVRVSRNCSWNHCAFCSVYKGARFELRAETDVIEDITHMAEVAARLQMAAARAGRAIDRDAIGEILAEERGLSAGDVMQVALFVAAGGKSAFLQDANSLIVPVARLVPILRHLRASFPALERVTSYARSHTVTKRSIDELGQLREAGLDRVHIGLESGSDRVLQLVQKGTTAAEHIDAGRRVRQAGLELSEYVMPGLGGRALSQEHARETARVLRAIDPHFIRLRSLAIAPRSPLGALRDRGDFVELREVEVVAEIRSLLAGLEGSTGRLVSDHALNLFGELEGELPAARARMLELLDEFLDAPEEEQMLFVVGRRLGVFSRWQDRNDVRARSLAERARDEIRLASQGPVDLALRDMLGRSL